MRPPRLLAVLALGCLSAAGIGAQQQVNVIATILDPATNAPAESLAPEDVRLTEDDVQLKVLTIQVVDRTVKAQILIDNGIGIGNNLSQLRSALRGLVGALPPDVETSIYTTAPQSRTLQRATKNREELLKAVDRLTPDRSPGRFTESLTEAGERASKDKDAFTVIILAGTTSGDAGLPEGSAERLIASVANRPLVVHVLLYAARPFGGDAQVMVGETVAKMTGGRYEYINNMNRYLTLLPEFADSVVKQMTSSRRQFRITAQRADGKSGPMGRMALDTGARIIASVRLE